MNLMDVLTKVGVTIGNNWVFIIIVTSLVQLSPLKIDPWTWFGKLIGKIIGIDAIKQDVEKLAQKVDENEAITARTRILRFGDEMMNDSKHSQEHFKQILKDIDRYEQYCSTHKDFPNNTTVITSERIKKQYQECLEKHTFL